MRKLIFLLPFIALFSCGEDAPAEEKVILDTYEQRLSYVLGSINAKGIVDSPEPFVQKLLKDKILEGFKEGLSVDETNACRETMQKLFGPYGQDFDTTYLEEGSRCIGLITGSTFVSELLKMEEMDKLDTTNLIIGFNHGLHQRDTLISQEDQMKMVEEFFNTVQEKKKAKIAEMEIPFWEEVKAIPGIVEVESGVYLETIKAGSGNTPEATDDVEAHYTLTNVVGEVMESTYERGEPLKINLTYGMGQGIIPGWTIGFTALKKGGKYKLYIPSELAYGEGALCFEVELVSFGPQGSMVTLQQQQPPTSF